MYLEALGSHVSHHGVRETQAAHLHRKMRQVREEQMRKLTELPGSSVMPRTYL